MQHGASVVDGLSRSIVDLDGKGPVGTLETDIGVGNAEGELKILLVVGGIVEGEHGIAHLGRLDSDGLALIACFA